VIENLNLDWDNSNKVDYYDLTRQEFLTLTLLLNEPSIDILHHKIPDLFNQSGINDIYNGFITILSKASLATIKRRGKKGIQKFWWNNALTEVKSSSVKHFDAWKSAGKPTDGPIYDAKFNAHKEYKKAVKIAKSNSTKTISDKLQNNLLNTNSKKFWRCWQGYFKNNDTNKKINVDGLKESFEIADHFS